MHSGRAHGRASVVLLLGILIGGSLGFLLPLPSVATYERLQNPPRASSFSPEISRPNPAPNGVRVYTLIAQDAEHDVFTGVHVSSWTLNGTVPGPALAAIEGETIKITFMNRSPRPQTLHFHGIHKPEYDGVHEVVMPGQSYVYELEATPPGVYLYHSHMLPIGKHQNKGFFGAYIVYPRDPGALPRAREFVFIMQFIDTDGDFSEAEFYAVNGVADIYLNFPLEVRVGEPVRIYLINMNIEFATFHIHANVFRAFLGLGMDKTQVITTDTIGLGWGQRAVLEFSYKYPGLYMFHDHISEHSDLGLRGWIRVVP